MHPLRLSFAALLVAIYPGVIAGVEEGPNPLSPVLVSEVEVIRPGEPFWVGLWLEHPEHYHSYWKAPGIVGIPTELDWKLPDGFSAGKTLYPVPVRVSMAGINAHGYHGETLLMAQITPPSKITGDTVSLRAVASWMCCWKTCHPGFKDVEISLPVSHSEKEEAPRWDPKWRPVFESTREKLPEPLKGWKVTAEETGRTLTFTITPIRDAKPSPNSNAASVYFFCGDGQVNSGSPQSVSRLPDGTLTLAMERSQFGPEDAATYPGLLYCKEGWLKGGKLHYGEIAIPRLEPKPNPKTRP